MNKRFKLLETLPQAYGPLIEFDRMLTHTGLDDIQRTMIKIRASQINGCAYCLNIHTRNALKYGELPQRIFVMSAWREAPNWFSETDRVILQLTEEVTMISNHDVSDDLFEKAINLFGKEITAYIILVIVSINAWNRLGVAFNLHPE